jgi:flagellar export protein FliJ
MKKFSFRLASVLRLRHLQVTQEREKLERVLSEITRLEQSLASMAEERAEAVAFVHEQPSAESADFRALAAFLIGLDARARLLRTTLDQTRVLAANQRKSLMAADRNERLVLKLREKRLSEWRRENDAEIEAIAQESWSAARRTRLLESNR